VFHWINKVIDNLLNLTSSTTLKIFSLWKNLENSLLKAAKHSFNWAIKINPLPLYRWIKLPPSILIVLENLRSQLFFEYTMYTPFLSTIHHQGTINTRLTSRRRRGLNIPTTNTNFSYTPKFDKTQPTVMTLGVERLTLLGSSTPIYLLSEVVSEFRANFINLFSWYNFLKNYFFSTLLLFRKTIGSGALYLKGLFIMFFIDACLTDDEPLWEPIEWSLVQSWILFIFLFAWIAENLITSAYGSYTGRDKRVWFAWYKTFWLIEVWYAISLGLAALFVTTPFYHELTYTTPFIVSWWTWYSRVFFL
jgi:hypothetical protein